jgi:amidohydrolase
VARGGVAGVSPGIDLARDVADVAPGVVALRRALHQHPELAFEEVWTAATLAGRMRALGLPVSEGLGGTGVLALLVGARPGPTLLIRADMDGLPIAETTGRPYASRLPDRSHACGHDAHSAVVAGVVEVLTRHRDRLAGRVAFVFQPADEPMRGARRMLDDGLLDLVQPDMSLSLHVLPMATAGQVVVQRGPLWASWDTRLIRIGMPPPAVDDRATRDVTRLAADVVSALYDLVEREGRSSESVTFRVRSLQAEQPGSGEPAQAAVEVHMGRGDPGHAALEVNLALYDNALRSRLLARIDEVAGRIVADVGGTLRVEVDHALPAVVNDDHVTAAVERAAQRMVGPARIITGWRNRFADDVALLLAAAPGCLMLLGTGNAERGITESWHRPGFDVDEDALPLGVHVLSLAALDLLASPRPRSAAGRS